MTTYENPPLNHLRDVIEKDEYPYDPDAKDKADECFECEVCGEQNSDGKCGIVVPMRLDKPPHTIRHDLYCLLCGQRYHFKSLGPILEEQNVAFEKMNWSETDG